jgi:hypothetical protein
MKRDISNLKAVAGKVEVMRKEIKELRTLLRSGITLNPNSTANDVALEATLGAISNTNASTSTLVESKPQGKDKKKKENKVAKAEAALVPKYHQAQQDIIKVIIAHICPSYSRLTINQGHTRKSLYRMMCINQASEAVLPPIEKEDRTYSVRCILPETNYEIRLAEFHYVKNREKETSILKFTMNKGRQHT